MYKELNKFFFYTVLIGLIFVATFNFFIDSTIKFFSSLAEISLLLYGPFLEHMKLHNSLLFVENNFKNELTYTCHF